MLARWAAPLCFPTFSSIFTRPENSSENSRTECNPVQNTAMAKEAETKTETQAGLAVTQDDSVALAALPRRRSSAGFASPDSELGGRRGSSVLCYQKISFWARGKKLLDRPKPFLHVHLRMAADPDLAGWSAPQAGPRRFWVKATCSRAAFRLRIRPMARHLDRAIAFP